MRAHRLVVALARFDPITDHSRHRLPAGLVAAAALKIECAARFGTGRAFVTSQPAAEQLRRTGDGRRCGTGDLSTTRNAATTPRAATRRWHRKLDSGEFSLTGVDTFVVAVPSRPPGVVAQ